MLLFSNRALLLLLAWLCGPVTAEVGTTFHQCRHFFYRGTPPRFGTPEGYKHICQFYQDDYRFATLYDTGHRAPVYSAYITSFTDQNIDRPEGNWMYEPQLAGEREKAMQPLQLNPSQGVRDSQAVLEDFRGTQYEQGHLNPSQHHATEVFREATFTLTNIVPQLGDSNRRWAADVETPMANRFRNYCNGVAYVITGGIPYDNVVKRINERVTIPEYIWSAYCCPAYIPNPTRNEKVFIPTYAVVGRNDPNSPDDIVKRDNNNYFTVREMSVNDLEKILQERTGIRRITLFDNHCS